MTKIFIIAGEISGDKLGAGLIKSFLTYDNIEIKIVGGDEMQATGMKSIFPMQDISLMGFAEIIPHIFTIYHHINQTIEEIEEFKPDIIITIDSPGFNFNFVKKLRKKGNLQTKFVHYVAPSVWAYKAERAKKTASIFDMLLVLFPFEPPYFEAEGLQTVFVGHIVADEEYLPNNPTKLPTISIFAGSRRGELKYHLSIIAETITILKKDFPNMEIILHSVPYLIDELQKFVDLNNISCQIITNKNDKKQALARSDIAIVKSGTTTLEIAMAGVPMVTIYKANAISAWIIRRLIKISNVNLVNILLEREIIPELLQEDFTPKNLANEVKNILRNGSAQQVFTKIPQMLKVDKDKTSSDIAVSAVFDLLDNLKK